MKRNTDLRLSGLLKTVLSTKQVQRETDSMLLSPESIFLSRIEIEQDSRSSINTEVFGVILQDYIGKNVELISSYHRLPSRRKLVIQEFYVEGKRVVNQAVVYQE